ncbi:putative serine/threonine protein kinase [Blattamonas nauphoetae]|uniref:Serine/threonine protein kinase n=1 Tax=Blattamonas nauphoetae TaxID=2049346 RepID=A0ABQ9XBD3_9EUKA|nr:putative serine/threonine protein kinase [Blattamonas nauphoetae]
MADQQLLESHGFTNVSYLGSGQYGHVYKGTSRDGVTFAIKIIPTTKFSRGEYEAACTLDSNDCPYITYYQEIQEDRNLFLVIMDYANSGSLQDLLNPKQPLPEFRAQQLLRQLLTGVSAIHKSNLIHRDIKPENILLHKPEGEDLPIIKISDFGLSRILTEDSMAVTHCGTPLYMAPEVFLGDKNEFDTKADIWSVGVIAYQFATGRLPYPANTTGELIKKLNQPLPPLPNCSTSFRDLILSLLDQRPPNRLSAEEALNHEFFSHVLVRPESLSLQPVDRSMKQSTVSGLNQSRQPDIEDAMETIPSKQNTKKAVRFNQKPDKSLSQTNAASNLNSKRQQNSLLMSYAVLYEQDIDDDIFEPEIRVIRENKAEELQKGPSVFDTMKATPHNQPVAASVKLSQLFDQINRTVNGQEAIQPEDTQNEPKEEETAQPSPEIADPPRMVSTSQFVVTSGRPMSPPLPISATPPPQLPEKSSPPKQRHKRPDLPQLHPLTATSPTHPISPSSTPTNGFMKMNATTAGKGGMSDRQIGRLPPLSMTMASSPASKKTNDEKNGGNDGSNSTRKGRPLDQSSRTVKNSLVVPPQPPSVFQSTQGKPIQGVRPVSFTPQPTTPTKLSFVPPPPPALNPELSETTEQLANLPPPSAPNQAPIESPNTIVQELNKPNWEWQAFPLSEFTPEAMFFLSLQLLRLKNRRIPTDHVLAMLADVCASHPVFSSFASNSPQSVLLDKIVKRTLETEIKTQNYTLPDPTDPTSIYRTTNGKPDFILPLLDFIAFTFPRSINGAAVLISYAFTFAPIWSVRGNDWSTVDAAFEAFPMFKHHVLAAKGTAKNKVTAHAMDDVEKVRERRGNVVLQGYLLFLFLLQAIKAPSTISFAVPPSSSSAGAAVVITLDKQIVKRWVVEAYRLYERALCS